VGLNVVHNGAASVATRYLDVANRNVTRATARLAAGVRVVSARDDAASLAIGSRLNVEVNGLRQGAANARQAITMLQIADGAAARVSDILTRLKTLSVQSGSGQLSNTERAMLDTEYQTLKTEIDRIAQSTQFNGNGLVDDGGVVFTLRQIPANGAIKLNGVSLELGESFSLADVQRGRVTYENSGGTSDGLVVSVARTDGTALGSLTGELNRTTFETTEYNNSIGLNNISASTAYARGGTGAGVRVAIIDTGVDFYHTDLDGQVVDGVDIIDGVLQGNAGTAGTTSGDGNDVEGHGTHVAAIVAAERDGTGTMGVAYDADIIAIRASTAGFSGNDVADSIDYARLNGAKVINMSLSFGQGVGIPNQITAAMVRAINAGVVIVAAAGNSALADPDFPASFAIDPTAQGALIAVAAADDLNQIAGFSNHAGVAQSFVVTAPGVNIRAAQANLGTTPTSNTVLKSGTSMASPHVAGAAAILTQLYGSGTNSDLSGAEIANLLMTTAIDLGDEGIDTTYGRGLIDLDKATVGQLRVNISINPTSQSAMSGQLNVASGQSATLQGILFGVTDVYESFSDAPSTDVTFKVGTGNSAGDDLTVRTQSISALSLNISDTEITTVADANDASARISEAINRMSSIRANLGASQNRLDFAAENLDTVVENTENARSNLLDLDVAREMTAFTAQNLLQQMGISALAQAQQVPRNLLQLFN
jgi:flagellin-like hook-associated protein FlgL